MSDWEFCDSGDGFSPLRPSVGSIFDPLNIEGKERGCKKTEESNMVVEEFAPLPPQRVYVNLSAHARVRVDVIIPLLPSPGNKGKPAVHICKTFQIRVKMCWLSFDVWPGSKLAVGASWVVSLHVLLMLATSQLSHRL